MSDTPDDQPEDFATLFAAYEREQAQATKRKKEKGAGEERGAKRGPQAGDKMSGRIVSFGEESAFVDLGGKSEGVIPLAELLDADGQRTVNVGDEVEAMVVAPATTASSCACAAAAAARPAPAELAQAHAHGLPVEGTVTARHQGRRRGDGRRRARLLPDLAARRPLRRGRRRLRRASACASASPASKRGAGAASTSCCRAARCSRRRRRPRAEAARAQLAPGKVVRGTVTSLASLRRLRRPRRHRGPAARLASSATRASPTRRTSSPSARRSRCRCSKIKTDAKGDGARSRCRAARWCSDPWQDEAARLQPGTPPARAQVARLEPFGAFVELAPGVDGLLHVSELGGGKPIRHPREAVKVGRHDRRGGQVDRAGAAAHRAHPRRRGGRSRGLDRARANRGAGIRGAGRLLLAREEALGRLSRRFRIGQARALAGALKLATLEPRSLELEQDCFLLRVWRPAPHDRTRGLARQDRVPALAL